MSEPWGRPQQPGAYPPQPGAYPPGPPYGSPLPGPGRSLPARGRRRGLWITLAAVGVVLVLGVGAGLFVLARQFGNDSPGGAEPKIPPAVPAPPADPPPARRGLYTTLPASCALLSDATVQALYPGATGKAGPTSDRDLDGLKQFGRDCRWGFVTGDYIRFVLVSASGMAGDDDALDTITASYKGQVARLGPSVVMPKVDGKRALPNLGDEANIIYGSGGEACRVARVLVRSQNVRFEATYGGCDRKPGQLLPTTPIDETTMMNGVLTMARDVLQQINKS